MAATRDWGHNRERWVRILETRTRRGLEAWLRQIDVEHLPDEPSLREWLTSNGVTGYAQSLLVMERFGYPDFVRATADELIDGQYADRVALRPIYDGIIDAAMRLGEVAVQARKTYVSLVAPRRTFARIEPTTRARVDVGLRIDGQGPVGRLRPSKIHETMKLQISLTSRDEVDAELRNWMLKAYRDNS